MTTIVLIPGLMNDGWIWRHHIGPLSRVAPVLIARTDGCDSLAAMAGRIVDGTVGPIAVAGHSMGGRVALEVLAQAPERVARLALLDTGAGPASEVEVVARRRLVEIARESGMVAVCDAWLPPMLGANAREQAGITRGIRRMLKRCTPDIFAAQQTALIERPDRTALLPTIACPTLVAVGAEDRWSPPHEHRAMADLIPGAMLEIVPDAGHMLPVEAREATARMLVEWARG